MRRRYLCNLLRRMEYDPADVWGDEPDGPSYRLQMQEDLKVFPRWKTRTSEEMLAQVKEAGFQVRGKHYLDYHEPQNALEKVMMDDLVRFARIIRDHVSFSKLLQTSGISGDDAVALLREVRYIAEGYEEKESEP